MGDCKHRFWHWHVGDHARCEGCGEWAAKKQLIDASPHDIQKVDWDLIDLIEKTGQTRITLET